MTVRDQTATTLAVRSALRRHHDGCWATLVLHDGRVVRGGVLWRPITGYLTLIDPEAETRWELAVDEVRAVQDIQALVVPLRHDAQHWVTHSGPAGLCPTCASNRTERG